MHRDQCTNVLSVIQGTPDARAEIRGSSDNSRICGSARFYQTSEGVLVYADVSGLPQGKNGGERIFGFHIHEGESCTGTSADPFADTGSHYDTGRRRHPCHAGDMPPLFGNDGHAISIFLTDRFTVDEIIGRTVVIHDSPDDFKTQPSGNAGTKIACGVIRSCNCR